MGIDTAHLPAGQDTAGNILLAISVFVAWQVTWAPYVSDYSRYMPENTSSWKTFNYTYFWSVAGASLVMCIGRSPLSSRRRRSTRTPRPTWAACCR